ncbi:MAG: hypothetical protein AABM30_05670 [Actinomycetota bacterium]
MRGRTWGAASIAVAIAAAFVGGLLVGRDRAPSRVKAAAPGEPVQAIVPVSARTLHPVPINNGIRVDPHDLEFAELVPEDGAVDGAWFVPAGRGSPQLAVAWHRGTTKNGYDDTRLWNLTLWNPEGISGRRWVPYRLIVASPDPIRDWIGRSGVRLADVTGDGHADLLVSIGIRGSNHAATLISVFATVGGKVRRIYGHGSSEDKRGARAYGRSISETAWGARNGMLWFDEPRGGQSVCCPDYRLEYNLRWTGSGWHRVSERRVPLHYG